MISSLGERSGSSRRFQALAGEFARMGHRVVYLERGAARRREERGDLSLHFTRETRSLPLTVMLSTVENSARALREPADVVYALKPLPNSCIPALLKRLASPGVRIALDMDDLDFAYYPRGAMRRATRSFFGVFPPRFHLITTHNEILGDFVSGLGVDRARIHLAAQGFDPGMFTDPEPETEMWQGLGLSGFRVAVYSASLGMTSDLDMILPPLMSAAARRDDLRVLILGEGDKVGWAEAEVAKRGLAGSFVFPGYVEHRKVPGLLALSSVALNYQEPTEANLARASLKLREYLAAGVPVVTNLLGGDRVFAGCVEEVASPGEMPPAMLRLLDEPPLERVSFAREFVLEHFTWGAVARGIEARFRELLETRGQK